ncbi:rhomboid family intramembrane serine protease [Nocardioides mangrovicus]|uniref:Rhomboid family intramembrane serine protease n=1 Tax=Nocardioides mangrovicus TaxID=2478913 RepID=A0A3L8NZI3_9ACTN|nr:rhomboid family intramembrane serine protease [Nocardioides mangrovicus]RLV48072.1 rhomboid family intramembrane serine protease [Nocardioides mangrovicus]
MHDAAVGFQCPECVKQGAKQTRQGKGTYGGARALAVGQTTMTLIGINVVVFVAIVATASTGRVVDALALLPASAFGNGHLIRGVADGAYWQLFTSLFTQQAVWHLGANMFSLYFLGPILEQVLGRARFLAVYLGSGLVGSAAVMWFSAPNAQTLGASGAIFGLLGALLVVALKQHLDLRQILFWLGLNLFITFFAGLNISWQGHLGGLVGGIVLTAAVVYAPRKNRESWQWTAIGVVVVAALLASVLRASQL